MAAHVPGEDAKLVEVEGKAVFGLGEDGEVLRDFFVSVLDFVEHEEGDDALAFGVLRDVERNVEIDHAGKNPAYAGVAIADQPPVFDDGVRGGFFVLAFVLTFPAGLFAWLVARFFGGLFGGLLVAFSVALARDGGATEPGLSAVPL